ncbi:hypothetical protein HZP34_03025 [Elizabethkingia anophelis]|nr:hypothetical protein [Elizabethkingia anophelis]
MKLKSIDRKIDRDILAFETAFGITREMILGKCRSQQIFFSRIIIANEIRNTKTEGSKKERVIHAAKLLNKDPSALYYYQKQYECELLYNPKFREFHQKFKSEQKTIKKSWRRSQKNQTRLEIEAKTEGNITQLRVLVSVKTEFGVVNQVKPVANYLAFKENNIVKVRVTDYEPSRK